VLDAIGAVLPTAVGVAISPIPIIAVILMLFTPRAIANGPAFLLGWVVGLSAVATLVYAVADGADVSTDPDASSSLGWGQIVLGVLCLALAVQQWRSRPAPGESAELPDWMQAVDSFTPPKAAGTGIVLSAVNPKNLILTTAASSAVAHAGLSEGDAVAALAMFVVIGSTGVGALVAYRLLGGDSARAGLDRLKVWLGVHSAAVMATIFTLIGAKILGDGLGLA